MALVPIKMIFGAAGGGGGGAFIATPDMSYISVTPGDVLKIEVGAGGNGAGLDISSATTGENGGDSIISSVNAVTDATTIIRKVGGGAGGGSGGSSGGAGGNPITFANADFRGYGGDGGTGRLDADYGYGGGGGWRWWSSNC